MVKTYFGILMFFLAGALNCDARLDESEQQSESRYGKPVKSSLGPALEGVTNHVYNYQGWTIRAAFVSNKTVRIIYSKGSIINADEQQAILNGEQGNGSWRQTILAGKDINSTITGMFVKSRQWKNSNGNTAFVPISLSFVTVETPLAIAFEQAWKDEQARRKKAAIPKF
ncbi:MAG: hypothetical protein PHI84_18345 [Kiritimatiellae bacterium]|nr:hypothetical protein [Kiritimatiellia bacterium]